MRLLLATPLYPPEPGGPATYAQLLEEGLGEFGIETKVVKFSDVRNKPKLLRHIAYFRLVYRAGRDADAILALDPVSVGLPALCAARLLRKPFFVKIVGDYAWEQGVQRFGITDSLDQFVLRKNLPLGAWLLRHVQRHVARSAKRIIVPSTYLKNIVQSWGIPENSIEVIYNAIHSEEGGRVPQGVETLQRPRIVSIGRLVPWKGMRELISAMSVLVGKTPASLIIVGDGPDRAALGAHAKSVLGDSCVFTGPLNHADTIAVLKTADVFVLNSTYEGLSHVLIEALMVAKPIITTRCGGNTEVITHEQEGLLIEPGSQEDLQGALTRLLGDESLRNRLAARALLKSAEFKTVGMLQKTAAFLHTI